MMAEIEIPGPDLCQPIELPHQFAVELNYLVAANHKLTLDEIERDREE
jgi:hypothetical protein